jgi:hypothetical protein
MSFINLKCPLHLEMLGMDIDLYTKNTSEDPENYNDKVFVSVNLDKFKFNFIAILKFKPPHSKKLHTTARFKCLLKSN